MSTQEAKKVTVAEVLALAEQVDVLSIDDEIKAAEEHLAKLKQAKKAIDLLTGHAVAKTEVWNGTPEVATPKATAKEAKQPNGMPATIKDLVIGCLKELGPSTAEDIGFELNLRTVQVYGVFQAPGNKRLFKKRGDGCWELV